MNSAQYECEGHTVVFLVNENNTVRINQLYEAQQNVSSHAFDLQLDKAIIYEKELISLGYDKVS